MLLPSSEPTGPQHLNAAGKSVPIPDAEFEPHLVQRVIGVLKCEPLRDDPSTADADDLVLSPVASFADFECGRIRRCTFCGESEAHHLQPLLQLLPSPPECLVFGELSQYYESPLSHSDQHSSEDSIGKLVP